MDKHKFIITVIFFIMAILNNFGLLIIDEKGVFGITFGALMICVSTCFEGDFYIVKINAWKIIKNTFYFMGWIFIVVTVYLKDNVILKNIMETFESSTLMLLSLGFTFLALMVSQFNLKKHDEIIKEESIRLDTLITEQNNRQIELKDLIKKISDKKKGDS